MLIVNQDKTRKEEEGQIFVELTDYRDITNIADCNRLGYWCDKAHLSHFIMECAKCFTQDELKNILKMNGNNIYIEKNNLLDAYKNGNADNKKMLENLFGKEMFRPKNIMERVKTYEDACEVLGISPVLNSPNLCICEKHESTGEMHEHFSFRQAIDKHALAYLKLCVITAALNEGWTPQFTKDEYRYYPWFWLYTKEEIAKMNKEERKKVVLFGGMATYGAHAGFAFAYTHSAPSNTSASVGSRLCFKSSALAKYAGEQFAEIYFAFMGK